MKSSRVSAASLTMRKVFEISPEQLPSLRAEPQISNTVDMVEGSFCLSSAAINLSRVDFHSTDSQA